MDNKSIFAVILIITLLVLLSSVTYSVDVWDRPISNATYYINTTYYIDNSSITYFNVTINNTHIINETYIINNYYHTTIENPFNDSGINQSIVYLNDTLNNINDTIIALSEIKALNHTAIIEANASFIEGIFNHTTFQITKIYISTEDNSSFNSSIYEYPAMYVIDRDRMVHQGSWNIRKNYAINSSISYNITSLNYPVNVTIMITYLNNGGG